MPIPSGNIPSDALEIRLPPRVHSLRVARAVASVIAGDAGFSYDALIQVRLAVSEICEGSIRFWQDRETHLLIRFLLLERGVDITIIGPVGDYVRHLGSRDGSEELLFLQGMVDTLELCSPDEEPGSIRIVKQRPPGPGP